MASYVHDWWLVQWVQYVCVVRVAQLSRATVNKEATRPNLLYLPNVEHIS